MKTKLSAILAAIMIVLSGKTLGQWSTSGTNVYYNSGNVGIGTSSPGVWFSGKVLEVQDNRPILNLESTGILSTISFTNTQVNSSTRIGEFHLNHLYDSSTPALSTLNFATYPAGNALAINASGNVGIGTTNPTNKLEVNGKIRSKEVIVEATGWPDYVFEEDYDLPTLAEIEAYINTHKHLPGVPSAKQVEEQGQSVGEIQKQLLKKIEEMTLHMIELKKENEQLKRDIHQLKSNKKF